MSCSRSQDTTYWIQWAKGTDNFTYLEKIIDRGTNGSPYFGRRSLKDYFVEQHTQDGIAFRSYILKGLYKCGSNLWGPAGVQYFAGPMATGKIVASQEIPLNEVVDNLLPYEVGSGTEATYNATCTGAGK